MSGSPSEAREMLLGIGSRHDFLKRERPLVVVVDNCCQVREFILAGLGPDTIVILDVYHFIMRYASAVFGGMKNPYRAEVIADMRSAIVKVSAQPNRPASYWTKEEQEVKVIEAYNKWIMRGAWSNAASKIHEEQLKHVQKGCLARPSDLEHICMDGSRIEGSHKGWNSLQRAYPSGIEVYTGLGHDFFLRRNIRIASARIAAHRSVNYGDFIASLYGSHHVQLVNHTAALYNDLQQKGLSTAASKRPQAQSRAKPTIDAYPTLPKVAVRESMGLVKSDHSLSFGGHTKVEEIEFEITMPNLEDPEPELDEFDCEPTDDVESSDITLPNLPSTSSNIHAFYRFKTQQNPGAPASIQLPVVQPSKPQPNTGPGLLERLRRPVHLPSSLSAQGLTRSQLLFSMGTLIDPRALNVSTKEEFYLFMDMRSEFQWTTFGMTASKWASAAEEYNVWLESIGKEKSITTVKKNPRALADKLKNIEPHITNRLLKQDFRSNSSQTETFWRKHCTAVQALVTKVEDHTSRSPAICKRCKTIKYTTNKSTNHRKNCCADGVAVTLKPEPTPADDQTVVLPHALPVWPQPQGIFSDGKYFNPEQFLLTVRDLYERVVEQRTTSAATGSPSAVDFRLEDHAFSQMFTSRTRTVDGHTYFRLYHDLELNGTITSESLISTIEGHRYLRIDCLRPDSI
ncbi:hypothetical protein BDN70DRAFT_814702 [Pholiota conissans]|uniref:Transposase n=1 Tax=Pholiota conissans TaxID=109636 RepID=A0A9P6CVS7_9AGAR|nr:hypothetical protein BDN70DRAFT_814702 [Pholiota conissans]